MPNQQYDSDSGWAEDRRETSATMYSSLSCSSSGSNSSKSNPNISSDCSFVTKDPLGVNFESIQLPYENLLEVDEQFDTKNILAEFDKPFICQCKFV